MVVQEAYASPFRFAGLRPRHGRNGCASETASVVEGRLRREHLKRFLVPHPKSNEMVRALLIVAGLRFGFEHRTALDGTIGHGWLELAPAGYRRWQISDNAIFDPCSQTLKDAAEEWRQHLARGELGLDGVDVRRFLRICRSTTPIERGPHVHLAHIGDLDFMTVCCR